MDLDRLYKILRETTVQLRKGAEVEIRDAGGVSVTDVYLMPHESEVREEYERVDVEFIVVGVNKAKAEEFRDELVEILKTYPQPDHLASGGLSYTEVGAEIGDQSAAFQLFALGQVLGLWQVFTPKTFGFSGAKAREMAGLGLVLISGFKAD